MEGFEEPPLKQLDLNVVKAVKVLGKGAMGTVFLAYDSSSAVTPPPLFALKAVQKSAKPDAERRARWETSVLSALKPHPFLPVIEAASYDSHDLVAWAVPYCSGGDLNVLRHRQIDRVFSPAVIRFYLAEIVCALDHLHTTGVAYRDLKPENVLIQDSGHVTLTDFDLSRRLSRRSFGSDPGGRFREDFAAKKQRHCPHKRDSNLVSRFFSPAGNNKTKPARVSPMSRRPVSFSGGERSNSFVGTEEYVSPEMVRGEGHEFAVDWWALGVLAYEMLYGKTPFRGKNRKETFRNVLEKEPEFVGKRTALMDLIGRLLEKDPLKRLGYYGGSQEIRAHEFFAGLRWDLLTEVLRPPFVPSTEDAELAAAEPFDVAEYFKGLKVTKRPPSGQTSPTPSMSSDDESDRSLTEF